MHVGVVNYETWAFFQDIYDDLKQNYPTSVFEWQPKNYPFLTKTLNDRSFYRKMSRFLQANDVVFFEWASEHLIIASHLPKHARIVTRLHRYELYEEKFIREINWDAVDKIILVSQAKKAEFVQLLPKQADKIEVISVAVDPDKFEFNSKPFRGDIGILCHLTPRKRVYELILAFSELAQANPDLHLHIGGGVHHQYLDYYAALQDLVKNLDLVKRVTFYGAVKDTAGWYKNVDIFISNSYSEGLQVAPMEAMASGCYCLSHHWNGSDELLPEPQLFYTDRQLEQKILDYCALSDDAKNLERKHMRSIVIEKFNINHNRDQVRAVIEAAAGCPLTPDAN